MKKLSLIVLAIVLVMTMSVPAFATGGGFVKSPSTVLAPELIEGIGVVITAIADMGILPPAAQEAMLEAYQIISEAEDLTTLCKELADLAKELAIPGKDLAVSDLFDLSGNAEGPVNVKIKVENGDNFVALLHRHNGEWSVVDNAKMEGNILSFTVDSFSPFAIVVNTNPVEQTAQTGMNGILIALLVAVAAVAVFVISKKAKKA